jgi:TPR repeat protein
MIRKIALRTLAAIGVLLVAFIAFFAYEMHRDPELADSFRAVTGHHPKGYQECLNGLAPAADSNQVSAELEENCRAAAQAGDPMAQFVMSRIARFHARQDPGKLPEAIDWLQKAAGQNNTQAMFDLGVMYLNGDGVETDLQRARELFTTVAQRKSPGAQIMLAQMYATGKGVQQDYVQAVAWLTVAIDQGRLKSTDAASVKAFRDGLTAGMTPEQQKQAKDLASQF